MANYPKEFEDLLQEYLVDGIITEPERRVLLRKAEQLGLDVEEMDLYITAQEQKVNQAIDAAAAKKRGKSCPFCGSPVPQLADKCPACANHITPEASEELQDVIEHLEEALINFKSGQDIDNSRAKVERYVRQAELYYGNNPKVKKLLENVKEESVAAEQRVKSRQRMNILGKVLSYNRKLTTAVAIALLIGIAALVLSIVDAVKGPDPKKDAAYCTELIQQALAEGDIAKAEGLYNGFEDLFVKNTDLSNLEYEIEKAKKAAKNNEIFSEVMDMIDDGQYDRALVKATSLLQNEKRQVAVLLIKKGKYDEGINLYDPLTTDGWYDVATVTITAMHENGDDSKIDPFLKKMLPKVYFESNQEGLRDLVKELKNQ